MSAITSGTLSHFVATSGTRLPGAVLIRLERPLVLTASFSSVPLEPALALSSPRSLWSTSALDGARVLALLPAPSCAGDFWRRASLYPIGMGWPASYSAGEGLRASFL